ncbi:MAG: twin-arginine translocase TatA/TatE family subunit [Nitrososphaerota archaeon]|nr:twin-arginine translocase TatA/TatE family subunit [Nitrososphaerota archaeon]MDG6924268.1 twin-arginine translocase TatA/TatE family subunit [Nitrososphaerota archaeon]
MAFDDPVVWVLIIAVVIFLFGANKIPQLARSLGQARREFDIASKEIMNPSAPSNAQQPTTSSAAGPVAIPNPPSAPASAATSTDPLLTAAEREGIDTKGKTRDQIATEIAWKLKSK